MAEEGPPQSIGDHYLYIQELTPAGKEVVPISSTGAENPWPLAVPLIALGLLVGVSIVLAFSGVFKNVRQALAAVGLAILLGSLPFAYAAVKESVKYAGKADPNTAPQEVVVRAVEGGLAITWQTEVPTLGGVLLATDRGFTTGRLQIPETKPETEHEVYITNLKPGTKYYLQIRSNADWFDNGGEGLEIITR